MGVWLPPRVSRELQEEARRHEAETRRVMFTEARYSWKREFDAQLDRIVPGMKLCQCPDPAPLDAVAQGARPGCWHVVWPGYQGGPMQVQPMVIDIVTGKPRLGGDGPPAEPGSWVFESLARGDLWNERANRERARIKREAEEARDRRRERERAAFDEECLEHYKAGTRTFVSMNRDAPWSQSVAGKRGAGRGASHSR